MDEKEIRNVYAIPANYTDSGKILGGMVEPRNAVETVFSSSFGGVSRIDADSDARHHSNCCNGSNTHASCSPVRYGYRRRFLISVLGSYMQVWNSQTKTSYEKGGIQI